MFGHRGERRENRDRLEAAQIMRARFLVDRQAIGDEEQIELAFFRELRLTLVEGKIGAGPDLRLGMTPIAPCATDPVQDETELELALIGHEGTAPKG